MADGLDSFVWVMMDSLLDSALGLAVMIPRVSDYSGAKLCPLLVSIVASLSGPSSYAHLGEQCGSVAEVHVAMGREAGSL